MDDLHTAIAQRFRRDLVVEGIVVGIFELGSRPLGARFTALSRWRVYNVGKGVHT